MIYVVAYDFDQIDFPANSTQYDAEKTTIKFAFDGNILIVTYLQPI